MVTFAVISDKTKRMVVYGAASAFLAWHSMTLVVVPALAFFPNPSIESVFVRYVELTRVKSAWSFFSPDVNLGSILDYEVGRGMAVEKVSLTGRLDKLDPAFFRYALFYVRALADTGAERNEKLWSLGQYLCEQHSAIRPKRVIFTARLQKRFEADDYLRGAGPLDPEYLEDYPLAPVPCEARNGAN